MKQSNSQTCPGQGLLDEFKYQWSNDNNGNDHDQISQIPELSQSKVQSRVRSQQQYIMDSICRTIIDTSRSRKMPECCSGNCVLSQSQFPDHTQQNYNNDNLNSNLRLSSLQNNNIKHQNSVADNYRMQQKFQQSKMGNKEFSNNATENENKSQEQDPEKLTENVLAALEQFTQNVKDGKYTKSKLQEVLEHIQ